MELNMKVKVGLVQLTANYSDQFFLPYSICLMQSYVKKYLENYDDFEFLEPLYKKEKIDSTVDKLKEAEIIFFSVYVWNFQTSLEICRRLKKINKDIVIVFGGPQVDIDYTEEFLKENPVVDIACLREGEATFNSILKNYKDFSKATGISYLNKDGELVRTEPTAVIENLDDIPSPYLTGIFDFAIKKEGLKWSALLETNRGCMNHCTSCNWGGFIGKRIRFFSLDRVKQEIEWMCNNNIDVIYVTDSNFGIYKRDLEITKFLVECKKRTDCPKRLIIDSTKNVKEHTFEIFKLLKDVDLGGTVSLAFQSLNEETIKSISRYNFEIEKFKEIKKRLHKDKIFTVSDFIVGLPNETYETFKEGISKIIEAGQHDRLIISMLILLPNIEMNKKEYREKYGIITKKMNMVYRYAHLINREVLEKQDMVVATNTMSEPDWIKSNIFSDMISCVYFNKLLQIPFLVINRLKGTSFSDLVERLLNKEDSKIFNTVKDLTRLDLQEKLSENFLYTEEMKKWGGIYWPPEEYAFIKIIYEFGLEKFYEEAKNILMQDLNETEKEIIEESFELNKRLIVMPFMKKDFIYKMKYNIADFYNSILNEEEIKIIEKNTSIKIKASERYFDSWDRWSKELVWYNYRKGNYLYSYEELE
jgi:tRNA A37 methylthiotransferase MiaB